MNSEINVIATLIREEINIKCTENTLKLRVQ